MKTLGSILPVTLFLFAAVAPVQAQRVQVQPAQIKRVQVQPAQIKRVQLQPGRGEISLLTADAVEKLKLADAQKEKYAKIEAEYKEKAKAAQDQFQAAVQGDRTKYKEALEKKQADTKKAREDHLARVEPILTAEQKTVFAQVKAQQPQPGPGIIVRPIGPGGAGIGQVLPPAVQQRLGLTEEQKKELEKIQKDVEAKVVKLLNDDQKKQFEELKKGGIRPRPLQPLQPRPQVQPAVPVPVPPPAIEPKKQ